MVLYAYIERLLAELFKPFTAENLPAAYAAEYVDEPDENTRQACLRLYGEIHSLSREQLEGYNQLDNSEDRSYYLATQRSTYIINCEEAKQQQWAVENAMSSRYPTACPTTNEWDNSGRIRRSQPDNTRTQG